MSNAGDDGGASGAVRPSDSVDKAVVAKTFVFIFCRVHLIDFVCQTVEPTSAVAKRAPVSAIANYKKVCLFLHKTMIV